MLHVGQKRVDQYGFGENIDSLSDVISFGVAPGMLLIAACQSFSIPYLNIVVALLILLCGVLRLARFNVITNSSEGNDKNLWAYPYQQLLSILRIILSIRNFPSRFGTCHNGCGIFDDGQHN